MKTIGIIGGGQLGLMIIEQAHLLGARTVCLDPAADAPAFALSDERIVAAYDDPAALEELCRRSDAVTYEFENVPGSVLIPLEKKYNIPQGFRPLFDSQDRLREKDNARAGGLVTPEYAAADDEASLRAAVAKDSTDITAVQLYDYQRIFKFLDKIVPEARALTFPGRWNGDRYELSSDFFTEAGAFLGAAQEKEENGGAVRQSKSEEADAVQSESAPAA